MWYSGGHGIESLNSIGYATSPDGINWTKDGQNPVLTMDAWNILLVFPSVTLDGSKYRIGYGAFLFNGNALGGAIGYSTMPG